MNDLSLATSQVPAHLKGKLDGVGRGNENVGTNIIVPRLKLLQKASNEVDKNHAEYVKGAEVGDFLNNLTKETLTELYCLSLHFKVEWAVWRNIDLGGGYGGSFATEAEAQESIATQEKPEEWSIKENHAHLILLKNPETGVLDSSPVIFDLTGAKLATSKAWNSKIGLQGGDRFASLWRISSKAVTSKTGFTYMNIDLDCEGWAQKEDYEAAELLYEQYAQTSYS